MEEGTPINAKNEDDRIAQLLFAKPQRTLPKLDDLQTPYFAGNCRR